MRNQLKAVIGDYGCFTCTEDVTIFDATKNMRGFNFSAPADNAVTLIKSLSPNDTASLAKVEWALEQSAANCLQR
jgi:hypothetical protein